MDERGFRVFVNFARVGREERNKDEIDNRKDDDAQPCAGEKRQACQLLCHSKRVWIGDRGGESHVGGEDGHAQADQRIPAEGIGKRDHHWHQ